MQKYNEKIMDMQEFISLVGLDQKMVDSSVKTAIGKTMRTLRGQVSREIYRLTHTKYKLIFNRMKIFNARSGIGKTLSMLTQAIPAGLLPHRQDFRPGGGVKFKGRFAKGAWVWNDPGRKGKTILARTYRSRYPVHQIKVPIRITSEKEYARIADLADGIFIKYLDHELKWRSGIL